MMFKITNLDPSAKNRFTHCGVLEFHQVEGLCYLPHWLMNNLLLCEGGLVNVQLVKLPIGTYVKLKPQNCLLSRLSDPSAVLEQKLRNFSCLTKGDMFAIEYDGSVEFDTPFVESEGPLNNEKPKAVQSDKEAVEADKAALESQLKFPGVGRRVDGKHVAEQNGDAPGCSASTSRWANTVQVGEGQQAKRYPCDEHPGYYIPDWNYDENILTFYPPSWFKEGEMDARGRPLKIFKMPSENSADCPKSEENDQQ
ncbi:Ubiquitin fusion degradation protein 1 like prote in [Trichuris trichiura]|uniref:Ubiquitin fusion degradation protein 1 like prote in n=1 Tax=Trichuris trichiura TaxID=36087 RepID=A0A077Z554_TRITR|nr:Ubiquitin fusion degradation protein 1 like prote in [Trichuris trichiura]